MSKVAMPDRGGCAGPRCWRPWGAAACGCDDVCLCVHRKEHKKRRVAKRRKTGRVWRKYSRRWWYWSSEGRQEWRRCKRHGASSAYWTKHHCNRHGGEVQEYSRFWWWTRKGRALWRQCKKEGRKSGFWRSNHCGRGR